MVKDLTLHQGPLMGGLLKLSRFGDIFSEFDRLWQTWDLDMKTFTDMQPKVAFPKVNVAETDGNYEVEVALAGFDREDISMELKDNCLCIKADRMEEKSGDTKKYLMKEISSRSFRRAINFPKKVSANNIVCNYQDGIISCVLEKVLPKVEDTTVKIDIK